MRDIAVCISNENRNITPIESIDSVYKAGFRNVFIQWYNKNWKVSQEEQLKHMKELGLNVIFAHLGYSNMNFIWEEGELGEIVVNNYKKDLDAMKENSIPLVVMHLAFGIPVGKTEIGLNRIRNITEYAKDLNIKVAFENTETSEGYLEYVLDNIKDSNVGLCYDIGHNHAHLKDRLNLDLYSNRIFAVHLHDNDGTADQHLLPFDGTINWEYNIKKLEENNYKGPVTLELVYWKDYTSIEPLEYFKMGYEVGEKLRSMFEEK